MKRASFLALLFAGAASAQSTALDLPASLVTPNFDRVFIGLAEAHEAGAYLARTAGPGAAWYNPAGLAAVDQTAASLNVRGLDLGMLSVGAPFPDSVQVSAFAVLPLFAAVVLGPDVTSWRDVRIAISGTEDLASNALAWWGRTDSAGHFTYVSDASLTSGIVAVSAAWAASSRFRAGASLGGSWTRLYENDRLSTLTTDQPSSSARSRLLSGLAFHFIPSAGAQWEPVDGLLFGMVLRSPGVRIWGRATVQGDRQDVAPSSSTSTSLQTGEARFDYRHPFALEAAVALRRAAWELELDLRYHASTGAYTLVSTDVPIRTVATPPGDTVLSPFAPVQFQGRAVLDGSLGGSVALSRAVRLHGGIYATPSPVAAGSPLFRQTDLYGVRTGVSFDAERFSASVGLGYETGRANTPALPQGADTRTDGSVRVQQVSLAFAAEFRR
ncbi:MAG: hypothetical protein ACJ79U_10140 [Myxococcales bacterium]